MPAIRKTSVVMNWRGLLQPIRLLKWMQVFSRPPDLVLNYQRMIGQSSETAVPTNSAEKVFRTQSCGM